MFVWFEVLENQKSEANSDKFYNREINEINVFYKSNNPTYEVVRVKVSRDCTEPKQTKRAGRETLERARESDLTAFQMNYMEEGESGEWIARGRREDRVCL
jgi:hypothetical protein